MKNDVNILLYFIVVIIVGSMLSRYINITPIEFATYAGVIGIWRELKEVNDKLNK